MTKLELLHVFLNDRLTAAARDIFGAVKDAVVEYQTEILRSKEENERLRRLLNAAVQRLLLQAGEEQLRTSAGEDGASVGHCQAPAVLLGTVVQPGALQVQPGRAWK